MTFVSSNMGLTVWDLGTDAYDHSQLANNLVAIDTHDHSTGKGVRLSTGSIANNAVTSALIADGAVGTTEIADRSVTEIKLAIQGVGTTEIADASVTHAKLAPGAVQSDSLDPTLIPLGTVIPWYRPNSGVAIPAGGWEVCDGRLWSTITNSWGVSSGTIPDMRNKFILGAATTGIGSGPTQNPDVGQTGGSHTANLAHTHTVASHTHTTPDHTHTITADGTHTHSIASDGDHNHDMHSRQNAFTQTTDVLLNPSGHTVATLQSLYIASFNPGATDTITPLSGAHTHGGAVGAIGNHSHGGATALGGASTTGSATPATDSQLSASTDIRPGYVGLLYIMKVRI